MITASSLKARTAKDLAQMAKHRGVTGWHSMRKEQLIRALVRVDSQRRGASGNGKSKSSGGNGAKKNGVEAKRAPVNRRIQRAQRKKEQLKDISSPATANGRKRRDPEAQDRIVLMVRDAFWLHAYWEISSRAISRARAAMAEQWHTAKPVLRVMQSSANSANHAAETVERDIEIHGGVNNWYIDVSNPPKTFRVEIGYLASTGRFVSVARSNSVTTPKTNSSDMVDHNWTDVADNCDKILAQSGAYSQEGNDGELQKLFEERLRRPMGSPMLTRYGVGAESMLERERAFSFEVDAEMIVFGATQPDAHVTLGGKPVKIRHDGTFTVRMSMTEGRQVLPVVSSSSDGMKQQTIILAIERNTKTMEPVARETK